MWDSFLNKKNPQKTKTIHTYYTCDLKSNRNENEIVEIQTNIKKKKWIRFELTSWCPDVWRKKRWWVKSWINEVRRSKLWFMWTQPTCLELKVTKTQSFWTLNMIDQIEYSSICDLILDIRNKELIYCVSLLFVKLMDGGDKLIIMEE